MSENNSTQPEASTSSPLPARRSILTSAGLASLLIGVLIAIYPRFHTGFLDVLFVGFINSFLSLPITAFIVWVLRAFKLPSRLELPVAVLAGAAGLRLVLWAGQSVFD